MLKPTIIILYISRQTGLDYVFFGYVEHPELFESKNSLREMTERFANHLRTYFLDSAFIRNKDNANYVAKSYMMALNIDVAEDVKYDLII